MQSAGGRMSSLRTGAIGDGLIWPGPRAFRRSCPPGSVPARRALPQLPDQKNPVS
jgi:hypothetical protein